MHITLINPPSLIAAGNYSTISHPPIGLASITAYLRQKGHSVTLIDTVGEGISTYHELPSTPGFFLQGLDHAAILKRIPPHSKIIGVGCMFSHAWVATRPLIHRIAGHFPGALLIAGGEHVTALYDRCLNETPLCACVLGEGEETMAELASAVENSIDITTIAGIACKRPDNTIAVTPSRHRIRNLNNLPFPDWKQVPLDAYTIYEGPASGPTIPMLATRGCPHACTFCSAPGMWGKQWVARRPENIVKEMEHHIRTKQITAFQLPDINPFISRRWTRQLCRLIIDKGLNISWQMPVGTSFEAIDADTARLLVASGCHQVQYAPESGSPRILAAMHKTVTIPSFENAVGSALSAGMVVSVLFILGYPGETIADVVKTFRLIGKLAVLGVHEIAISSFVPLPGTAIFRRLLEEGRIIINDDYLLAMASATSLSSALSWNPAMNGRRLRLLKWLGLLHFFIISWMFHPGRLIRRLANLLSGRQETKADRVLRELVEKRKVLRRLKQPQKRPKEYF